MAPSPSPDESLPLLSGASASSGRHGRPRNASFESGFPLVVDASFSSVDGASDGASDGSGHAERAHPPKTTHWSSVSASGPLLTLTLVMSAVGAGTLAVPYTFVLLPPVPAALALALVGAAMFFTADAILRVHVAVAAAAEEGSPDQERHATYQALARAAGGAPLANVAGALTALAVFGACVGCVRVVRDMAPSLLAAVGRADGQAPSDAAVAAAVWAVFMAVVLPLGFSRNISALRFSSYLGFGFSLYLVAAVAFRAASSRLGGGDPAPPLVVGGDAAAPERGHAALVWRLAEAVGMYNFTFMLHLNVIPLLAQLVASEMKREARSAPANVKYSSVSIDERQPALEDEDASREQARYLRALARGERVMRARLAAAIAACVAIYAAFGLCAASIYGPATNGNILLNLEQDPIMAVPRVAILFTILFSFPLLFHPLRALVLELAAWPLDWSCARQAKAAGTSASANGAATGESACSTTVTLAVSVALLAAQILCALHVPGIQVVFSFVGASILLVLCYLLPLAFFYSLYPWRSTSHGTARLAALAVLTVVAAVFCSLATAELVWQ